MPQWKGFLIHSGKFYCGTVVLRLITLMPLYLPGMDFVSHYINASLFIHRGFASQKHICLAIYPACIFV